MSVLASSLALLIGAINEIVFCIIFDCIVSIIVTGLITSFEFWLCYYGFSVC